MAHHSSSSNNNNNHDDDDDDKDEGTLYVFGLQAHELRQIALDFAEGAEGVYTLEALELMATLKADPSHPRIMEEYDMKREKYVAYKKLSADDKKRVVKPMYLPERKHCLRQTHILDQHKVDALMEEEYPGILEEVKKQIPDFRLIPIVFVGRHNKCMKPYAPVEHAIFLAVALLVMDMKKTNRKMTNKHVWKMECGKLFVGSFNFIARLRLRRLESDTQLTAIDDDEVSILDYDPDANDLALIESVAGSRPGAMMPHQGAMMPHQGRGGADPAGAWAALKALQSRNVAEDYHRAETNKVHAMNAGNMGQALDMLQTAFQGSLTTQQELSGMLKQQLLGQQQLIEGQVQLYDMVAPGYEKATGFKPPPSHHKKPKNKLRSSSTSGPKQPTAADKQPPMATANGPKQPPPVSANEQVVSQPVAARPVPSQSGFATPKPSGRSVVVQTVDSHHSTASAPSTNRSFTDNETAAGLAGVNTVPTPEFQPETRAKGVTFKDSHLESVATTPKEAPATSSFVERLAQVLSPWRQSNADSNSKPVGSSTAVLGNQNQVASGQESPGVSLGSVDGSPEAFISTKKQVECPGCKVLRFDDFPSCSTCGTVLKSDGAKRNHASKLMSPPISQEDQGQGNAQKQGPTSKLSSKAFTVEDSNSKPGEVSNTAVLQDQELFDGSKGQFHDQNEGPSKELPIKASTAEESTSTPGELSDTAIFQNQELFDASIPGKDDEHRKSLEVVAELSFVKEPARETRVSRAEYYKTGDEFHKLALQSTEVVLDILGKERLIVSGALIPLGVNKKSCKSCRNYHRGSKKKYCVKHSNQVVDDLNKWGLVLTREEKDILTEWATDVKWESTEEE